MSKSKRNFSNTLNLRKKHIHIFYFALCFFAKVEEQRTVKKLMRRNTRIDDQSVLLHLAFFLVSLKSQNRSVSSARFDSPVSALDKGFKREFFIHLYSSRPKSLQKLHWDTLKVACTTETPTLSSELFSFTRGIFARFPLDNKATFSLLAVAVCRLRELLKF